MSYTTVPTTGINPNVPVSTIFNDGFTDTFNDHTVFNKLNAGQLVATDGAKQLISQPFGSTATASTIVSRDSSGDSTFNTVKLSGLTASQAVVTDSDKKLASMQYTDAATANTIVSRDANGAASFNGINLSALSGYGNNDNGYVLVIDSGQVKTMPMSSTNNAYSVVCRTSQGNCNVGYFSCYRIRPANNNTWPCGESGSRWKEFYSKNITDDNTQVIIHSHCLPNEDGTQDLGSASKQWKDIYSVNALTVSDQNLKKDVVTDETDYYNIIDQVRVVKFNWASDQNADEEDPSEIGVIAQELEQVIPQLVRTEEMIDSIPNYDEDGNQLEPTIVHSGTRKFVNYNKFIPILISCIQSMKAEIEELKSRVDFIEN
jgi:hypothetical protein